jgi:hypothetical protein
MVLGLIHSMLSAADNSLGISRFRSIKSAVMSTTTHSKSQAFSSIPAATAGLKAVQITEAYSLRKRLLKMYGRCDTMLSVTPPVTTSSLQYVLKGFPLRMSNKKTICVGNLTPTPIEWRWCQLLEISYCICHFRCAGIQALTPASDRSRSTVVGLIDRSGNRETQSGSAPTRRSSPRAQRITRAKSPANLQSLAEPSPPNSDIIR